jgi:membrane protein DedA with SNARE-associated domain
MAALLFYAGLLALLTLEEAGVFLIPGDISLVAAGINAAQGDSYIFVSWICASVGMIAGSTVLYRAVGASDTLGRAIPDRVVNLIHRHQIWGVFLARLIPGLRNATVFAASASDLPYRTFLIGLVPAAFVWSGAVLVAGYFGGNAALSLFGELHHSKVLKVASLGLLFLVALGLLIRLRRQGRAERLKKRREARAAASKS